MRLHLERCVPHLWQSDVRRTALVAMDLLPRTRFLHHFGWKEIQSSQQLWLVQRRYRKCGCCVEPVLFLGHHAVVVVAMRVVVKVVVAALDQAHG